MSKLPHLTYAVGEKKTGCPKEADKLAKDSGGHVHFCVGDKEFDSKSLILLLLSIAIFQLAFLSIGMLISLLVKRVRNVTPYAMALGLGMYILSAFGGMLGEDKFDIITPFKHFEPNYIINHRAYDTPLVMISVAFIIVSIVGSYLLYTRRNIASAV